MRILIYSVNFAPEPTGIGKYSGEMAAWLAEQGHEVHVVAAPPYYPSWRVERNYAWPPYRRERWCGVTVLRAPLWVPKSPSGVTRILHLISFAISSTPLMLRQIFWRPHVVVTVAPAFVCVPVGWLAARLARAQAWLHLQDFEVDIAFELGLLKNKTLRRAVLGLERFLMRRFDRVSTISQRMVERLLVKGVPAPRTHLFQNWVDTALITPEPVGGESTPNRFRTQAGIAPEAIVVLFSGTLGVKQGLLLIPEVAQALAHRKDIMFVICGSGVMRPRLEAAAANLPNVRLLPLQPLESLGELLRMADIHLLTQSPSAEDLVLPSKLSGMIASGRPVIATCREGTELANVVAECGLVVPPEDCAGLANAVLELADDPALRRSLGRKARTWAETNIERSTVLEQVFGHLSHGTAVPAQRPVPVASATEA